MAYKEFSKSFIEISTPVSIRKTKTITPEITLWQGLSGRHFHCKRSYGRSLKLNITSYALLSQKKVI